MAPIGQSRTGMGQRIWQPAVSALPRRAGVCRGVFCKGGHQQRRQRLDFQYCKSLISMRFRTLLEKADKAMHRAPLAIQAVAQAEQQVRSLYLRSWIMTLAVMACYLICLWHS